MTSSEQTNLDAQCTYPLPPMHFWLVKVKYFKDFPLLVSIWIQMEILAWDEKSKETAQDYGFLCANCRVICFLWNNVFGRFQCKISVYTFNRLIWKLSTFVLQNYPFFFSEYFLARLAVLRMSYTSTKIHQTT